ncbi:MAG: hypothetical protein HQ518_21395, partial [Rhodopirellula sp.]|nr:hypothetical protein [Rhodopirellula sp.]
FTDDPNLYSWIQADAAISNWELYYQSDQIDCIVCFCDIPDRLSVHVDASVTWQMDIQPYWAWVRH